MKSRRFCILATFVIGVGLIAASTKEVDRRAELLSSGSAAVEVKAIDGAAGLDYLVTDVFYGPADLQGIRFTADELRRVHAPVALRENMPPAPHQLGDQGIWRLENGKPTPVAYQYGFKFPVWPSDPQYNKTKSLVEALRAVDQLDQDDRVEFLKRAARGPDPQFAVWAVRVLVDEPDQSAVDFLREFVTDEKVAFPARLTGDWALEQRDAEWTWSDQRMKLLLEWAARQDVGGRQVIVSGRLHGLASTSRAVDKQAEILRIVRAALANESLTWRIKQHFVRAVSSIGRKDRWNDADAEAFEFLVEICGKNGDARIRNGAADAFRLYNLDVGRRRLTITELMELEDDPRVKGTLESILLLPPS
jgi:hypothetical protein